MSCELIGPIYGDSYGGGWVHIIPVGCPDLSIGQVHLERLAPYRIDQRGTTLGWAPPCSLRPRGISKPMAGLFVRVKEEYRLEERQTERSPMEKVQINK
jgi:hypothetical protein